MRSAKTAFITAPRDCSRVDVWIEPGTGLPLQVQVFGKDSDLAALDTERAAIESAYQSRLDSIAAATGVACEVRRAIGDRVVATRDARQLVCAPRRVQLLARIAREHAGAVERVRAYQELAVQRLLNHARLARMIEHEAFLGDDTYRPAQMLDDARAMIWREVGRGQPIDTYRRNMQRAYLEQAQHLLHTAASEDWNPPGSGNLRVGSNNDPPLNADLHIAQSDIRPLVRDQLKLLQGEIEEALRGLGYL